jgi:hypothetical protein
MSKMVNNVFLSLHKKYLEFEVDTSSIPEIFFVTTGKREKIIFLSVYADSVTIHSTFKYGSYTDETHYYNEHDLQQKLDELFVHIAKTYFNITPTPIISSKISALDIEINRSRNKLKYMEAQLFPNGMPKSLPSGKST